MTQAIQTAFENLEEGDIITTKMYENPMEVTRVGKFSVDVECVVRGHERTMIQNKPNPERIIMMVGADTKGDVKELVVIEAANEEDDDEEEAAEVPNKKTGAELLDSVVRVRVDDDDASSRYTIHVEHPNHSGGVRCFWVTDADDVPRRVRKHIKNEVTTEFVRIDVVDAAGIGLSEHGVLGTTDDVQTTVTVACP